MTIRTLLLSTLFVTLSFAQGAAPRASIVEDRAAKKLLEAGDARIDADEPDKALEVWQSVVERYPASRYRFDARMRLGAYLLEQKQAYDQARLHFSVAASVENPDDAMRAQASLQVGVCQYETREYGRAFTTLRDVISEFPTAAEVNDAYYYIGLAHFKQGHYSRAIEALEKVGTAITEGDKRLERVEAGRRLFVRIDDRDFSTLDPGESVTALCRTKNGDEETVVCNPVGRDAVLALGSIATHLSPAQPGNGVLEVGGGDEITITYSDQHTSDQKFDQKREVRVAVVGTALAQIMDGPFLDQLDGVVVGKSANLQVVDADLDRSPGADKLKARVEVHRRKSDEQIEDEVAALITQGKVAEGETPAVDPWFRIDQLEVSLTEASEEGSDKTHTGIFRTSVPLVLSENTNGGNQDLEARPGDQLRLLYQDEVNLLGVAEERVVRAACIEGDLGEVRVSKTEISDQQLQLKTQLHTAGALTQIGNHYRDFGLSERAQAKYGEALDVSEEVVEEARKIGGTLLEETYVQLWRIYFAMEEHGKALAMANRLQSEFPESQFVDEAMLQQAHVAREGGDLARAITLYGQVAKLKGSDLRGEAQFGVAECYEAMALAAGGEKAAPLYDRAFQEFKTVYEEFPESGRVGDAVAKMANFYYQKEDYARAIDTFENVLSDHPDAGFLDVILFNYGRCLFRLERKPEARRQFDQLISEYPESKLSPEAKRISDALAKAGF